MSIRTPELAEKLVQGLSEGIPLRELCRQFGVGARTVYDWFEADPELAARIAQARARGFDAIAAECLDIADDARNDWMTRQKGGVVEEVFDAEHVQRSKLRIETRLKLLAKWDPKRYGEKLAIGGAEDLPPIKTMSDDQLEARIAALQAKLARPE